MVQTRSQAKTCASNRIVTRRFLKEVRIPVPPKATNKSCPHQDEDSITTKSSPIVTSSNAPAQSAAAGKLFSALRLPLRLYAPPTMNRECISIFDFLEYSVVNAIIDRSYCLWKAVKPKPLAVDYVLHEMHQTAVRMAGNDEEMEVIAHASLWTLRIWMARGELGGAEYGEGVTEMHLGMYEAVRAMMADVKREPTWIYVACEPVSMNLLGDDESEQKAIPDTSSEILSAKWT